ncbi:transcription factor [Halobaculum sp. WSA2]|uniref:Transcription factor n=1 Tax=Halobaculum saliterrae TaxID=2073113 RepID=A0A6B0SVU7_9EURY|nr:transcription factor [Halobaculum saliterrae]MXR40070.1 transcription factor [Halobaculum saliterrae]
MSTMGSGELGREIELSEIIEALSAEFDIEANTHGDSTVTIRLEEGGPAFTLYRTGSFQIRGTESREALFEAKEDLLDALQEIGVEFDEVPFRQNNAVYLADFGTEIQLETLAIHLGLENVEYEPEQFPGVIYRPPELGTVMLIFASGKSIISGTISREEAKKSESHLQAQILQIG